eukprot:jgi/Orpsp1_1/1184071/evm.model.c7180000087881.1
MKFIQILLSILLTTLALSLPINTEVDLAKVNYNNKIKRFDVGTYLSSVGNFLTGSNI